MQKFLILALAFAGSFAHAGATQVFITCQAKGISLEASFPGDMLGSEVILKTPAGTSVTLDEAAVESAKMNNRDLPQGYKVQPIAGVDSLASTGVVTLVVLRAGYPALTLSSQPQSAKSRKTTNGRVGTFNATLRADDVNSTVACKYQYEI